MRAALYTRVSTDLQAEEGFSLGAQLDRLRAFCDSQSWEIADVYTDEGQSAKTTNRPELRRLLSDVAAGRIDVVLVYKLDRLTRSVSDLYELLQLLDRHGCGFRSATEVFDTTSAIGRLFITIVAALAQWERENLAERSRMGQVEMTRQGKWSGGRPPFGYEYTDGRLVPHEEKADLVREIFTRYNAGAGHFSLLKWLNDPLDPKPSPGQEWTLHALKYLLQNPVYAGRVRYGFRKRSGRVQSDWMEAEGQHEAVVPLEAFQRAQEAIAKRAPLPGRAASGSFPLTGVLRCGLCGAALSGVVHYKVNKHVSPPRRYYKCNRRAHAGTCALPMLPADALERAVLEEMDRYRIDVTTTGDAVRQEQQNRERHLKRLARQLATLPGKRKHWMDTHERGTIGDEDLRERLALLDARARELRLAIAELERATPDPAALRRRLESLQAVWDEADSVQRKDLIQAAIARIMVDSERTVTVTYRNG